MNHTRLPKEDHLPDWARRDNQVKKGDDVDCEAIYSLFPRPATCICIINESIISSL